MRRNSNFFQFMHGDWIASMSTMTSRCRAQKSKDKENLTWTAQMHRNVNVKSMNAKEAKMRTKNASLPVRTCVFMRLCVRVCNSFLQSIQILSIRTTFFHQFSTNITSSVQSQHDKFSSKHYGLLLQTNMPIFLLSSTAFGAPYRKQHGTPTTTTNNGGHCRNKCVHTQTKATTKIDSTQKIHANFFTFFSSIQHNINFSLLLLQFFTQFFHYFSLFRHYLWNFVTHTIHTTQQHFLLILTFFVTLLTFFPPPTTKNNANSIAGQNFIQYNGDEQISWCTTWNFFENWFW